MVPQLARVGYPQGKNSMKTTVIHRPGSLLGACKNDCWHARCHAEKNEAATLCRYCGAPIGYNQPHYEAGGNIRAHVLCTAIGPQARAQLRESLGLPV